MISCKDTKHPELLELGLRLQMQAEKGENTTERPMWAEKGGLDFEGRAKWDAWTSYKGMATAKARLQLVKVKCRIRHG